MFDRRKDGNPNVVSGGLSLIVCAAAAFVGVPRTVNGTGHTDPSEFCATSI